MPTVLIVDDDKHMRAVLERMFLRAPGLRPYGLKVVQAADGAQGLEVADRERPDVIVCDLLMPRLDGWGFCRALRQRPYGAEVALLVMSGLHRERGVADEVREEFSAQFFAKPHELTELPGAVERLLAARLPQPAAGTPPPAGRRAPPSLRATVRMIVSPFEGRVADKNLPSLLFDLHEGLATGILDLSRGRLEKRIELIDGHPVNITSNQRSETLGHFLVEKKVISLPQHQRALERAVSSGVRLGEALVEIGAITAPKLVTYLQLQARQKIAAALRWPDGAYAYRPHHDLLDRARATSLDGPGTVFWGLRETANVNEAARTCEGLKGRRIALTPRGQQALPAFARAFGDALAQALVEAEEGASVDELLSRRFEVARVFSALEALLLTGSGRAEGAPPSDARQVDPLGLDVLSAARRPQRSGQRSSPGAIGEDLYDVLFGDEAGTVPPVPAPPPPLVVLDGGAAEGEEELGEPGGEQSGVIDLTDEVTLAVEARDELLLEYLRVQGKDWYAVLQVPRDADPAAIEGGFAERTEAFSLEKYASLDLGRDYGKLEELHVAYRRARQILGDPARRRVYDQQIGAGPARGDREAIDAEIHFHHGEEQLTHGDLDAAILAYRTAVKARPDAADYHASLGWALFLRSRRVGREVGPGAPREAMTDNDALASAAHFTQALSINPDHPGAHALSGCALAERGDDPGRALAHLERALDARPPRFDALEALETLRRQRGELRELERVYKKLIHRVGDDRPQALRVWLSLAELYRGPLADRDGACVAYQCAARLDPSDARILRALDELTAGDPGRFGERAEALRGRFRLDRDPEPIHELVRAASEAGQNDAAFVAAAVLLARDLADDATRRLHDSLRAATPRRTTAPLGDQVWPRLRHADDDPEIGALFALLDPLAAEVTSLSLGDLGVRPTDRIVPERLPAPLGGALADATAALGVRPLEVYRHRDFAEQIHIGALNPPVLLVGPLALEQEDRVELAFWAGRALSFVRPGRALGASRPGRVLKALVASALSLAHPQMALPDPDGLVGRTLEVLRMAPEEVRSLLREAVGRVTPGRSTINLSEWARALGRSADRVGLLLCGDPAIAGRAVAGLITPESLDDLLDYALSADHLAVRRALGLAMDT